MFRGKFKLDEIILSIKLRQKRHKNARLWLQESDNAYFGQLNGP